MRRKFKMGLNIEQQKTKNIHFRNMCHKPCGEYGQNKIVSMRKEEKTKNMQHSHINAHLGKQ